ncbi:MAG TPA: response regulator [Polyangiaceae bacterium]|nr:response regulator [Polyangiaceae bacterium]
MNEKPAPNSGRGQRGQVWVVDDSPLETEVARRVLGTEHDVRVFADGPTVLELLANGEKPDLLVLDWHMPEMSGLEMCRFLRESHDEASLPILVLTATGGQDDLLEGLAAGANDFVIKDFDPAELLARAATLVRAKALHEGVKRTELATRRAREAAEEASRAKDVFLATVSHELRTPLNAILGWARLLNEGEGELDSFKLKRGLETIERNARLQLQLIEDILDVTRAISGKMQLEVSRVDLASVIRTALDSLRPTIDAKRIQLELADLPKCHLRGDAERIQQALLNLLNNAIKFTPEGGTVRVAVKCTDAFVHVSVSDTGIGIPPQFLPHVFDRFRQQDGSVSRRHSGLGLGLALVQHIAQAHGGSVSAESPGEGLGATFILSLPSGEKNSLVGRDSDRPSPMPPAPAVRMPIGKLAGLNILIVEDDEDSRDLLGIVLEQQGATVEAAGSCASALAILERVTPDVMISDIGLPKQDGYELIRSARAREKSGSKARMPAIALTAYARREDRRLALEAGFQAHVAKPVDPAELVGVVSELIRAPNDS